MTTCPRDRLLDVLVALTIAVLPVAAEDSKAGAWQGLKQMMSEGQFSAAGLDRLSAEELRQLDRWILNFLAHESQQLVKADEKIQKLQQDGVRRRIEGHFRGWRGNTVFRLDNGEVWKQRLDGRYAVSLQNPAVEIRKNLFGFYEMKVLETGRRIGVTRIE